MTEDLSSLVDDASRGDDRAVESLLAHYLPDIERFLRGRAPAQVLAKESGADLAQSVCREVLERLVDERFEYRGEAEFRRWLYNAAELKLKNRFRFYGRDRRAANREVGPLSTSGGPAAGEALYRTLFTPSQHAIRREELERFEEAFAGLSDDEREVIRLFHMEGLSHREIADRRGIQEGHSRTLLSRALARLAKLAHRPGEDEGGTD